MDLLAGVMTESLRHCSRVVVDDRGCYGVKVGVRCRGRGEQRGTGGEIKKIENPITHVRIGARARTSRTSACACVRIRMAKNCACVYLYGTHARTHALAHSRTADRIETR